ncbi:hypothetical protein [Planococcus chinensis]|uniref:Uncharacterized protein n=1 Tax=Planococcus chinensis TaxID=272917 RepID=A0ABW4QGS9_9BACL
MIFSKKMAIAAALAVALTGAMQLQAETEVQAAAVQQEEAKPLSSVPVIVPPL